MGTIRGMGMGVGLAVALMGGALVAPPAEAQVVTGERFQCECVDADGNRIENCTCIRGGDVALESFTLSRLGLDRRAQIGVLIEMNQDDEAVGGVVVTDVMDGSPASQAGLVAGDVIVSIDGRSVFDELDDDAEDDLDEDESLATQRFVKIVGGLEPGEQVEIVVLRDGVQRMLRVTPEPARNTFIFRGLGDEMEFDFRGDFEFDEEQMRGLQERLEQAGEKLREMNFRFEGDPEDLERRIREEVERVEEETGLLRELAREREQEFGRLEREMAEERAATSLRRGVLFPRSSVDPCIELHTAAGGEARLMVLGYRGCIDGVRLTEMNEGLASYFGTDAGVLVTEVADESSLGLVAGDVILRIGDRDVEDADDVRRILDSYDMEETVTFRVRRENREIQVSGTRR